MLKLSHRAVSALAFDLLKQEKSRSEFEYYIINDKSDVAHVAAFEDRAKELEFVDVEGTGGGKDNPHARDASLTILGLDISTRAVEDIPHYGFKGLNFAGLNHFIDIRKGPGIFDDYDGYAYHKGSGSKEQYQTLGNAIQNGAYPWYAKILAAIVNTGVARTLTKRLKVDRATMGIWFNDEYVHAPGHEWYRYGKCSPSVERYSFYKDKGRYSRLEDEAKARFPRARATGRKGRGIPYSVFLPVDNMARYWFTEWNKQRTSRNAPVLGSVLHAIQDATIPHHAGGILGNWHAEYEAALEKKIDSWVRNTGFRTGASALFGQWDQVDPAPPTQLNVNDWSKTPCRNWRIDMLVTWLALNAYRSYKTVHNNFRRKYFNDASMKELTQKAVAMSMLALWKGSRRTPSGSFPGITARLAEPRIPDLTPRARFPVG